MLKSNRLSVGFVFFCVTSLLCFSCLFRAFEILSFYNGFLFEKTPVVLAGEKHWLSRRMPKTHILLVATVEKQTMNTIGFEKTFAAEHNLDTQNVPVPEFFGWTSKIIYLRRVMMRALQITLAGIKHGTPTQKNLPKPQTPSAKKSEQRIEMNCMECKVNSRKRNPIGPD